MIRIVEIPPRPIVHLKGEYRPLEIVGLCIAALELAGRSEEDIERFERDVNEQWHLREILNVCERHCDLYE